MGLYRSKVREYFNFAPIVGGKELLAYYTLGQLIYYRDECQFF